MEEHSPRWLTERDVADLLNLGTAVDTVEGALRAQADGSAHDMPKTHVGWEKRGTLHAIGGALPDGGIVGTKTWTHTPNGAQPLLILFDATNGSLKAIIEAFTLGQLRTGAVSAVATRWLAPADAEELAIIGTGKQSLMQIAAVARVRDLQRVRVFSPHAERRAAFSRRLAAEFEGAVVEAASVAEAVAGARIITLVTRATQPFLSADMITQGAHINAIGAITPERAEFTGDVFMRAQVVSVDSVVAAQRLSREFAEHYSTGSGSWSAVVPLCKIVAERRRRPADADLTLFKAMGMGLADVALGLEVYERAVRHDVGEPIRR